MGQVFILSSAKQLHPRAASTMLALSVLFLLAPSRAGPFETTITYKESFLIWKGVDYSYLSSRNSD